MVCTNKFGNIRRMKWYIIVLLLVLFVRLFWLKLGPTPWSPDGCVLGVRALLYFPIFQQNAHWGWNLNWLLILGLLSIIWVIFCKNIISRSKLHLGSLKGRSEYEHQKGVDSCTKHYFLFICHRESRICLLFPISILFLFTFMRSIFGYIGSIHRTYRIP